MHWSDRLMRRPAFNEPGHAHELTFTCLHRYAFLKAERTCVWLAESLSRARIKYDFSLWAYVFMPEHVHLVVHPRKPDYDIRAIIKAIKQPVGRPAVLYMRRHAPAWLERITVQHGSRTARRFWQPGGGFDRNVVEPKAILAMIEYIHANPVRRRLVECAEDWRWSSAGWRPGKNLLPPDAIDFGGFVGYAGGRE
jgi:putative transposase